MQKWKKQVCEFVFCPDRGVSRWFCKMYLIAAVLRLFRKERLKDGRKNFFGEDQRFQR